MFKNAFLILALPALFFLSSCGKTEVPETVFSVKLAQDPVLGSVLTDGDGMTLYYFSLDHDGESVFCTGDCIEAWPIFYSADITVGEGLATSDFGVVTRADGTQQTTYKGWPLYYFVNDADPGDTNGEGVNDVWFVAKPDYSVMLVQAQLIGRNPDGVETELKGDYTEGQEMTFYITDARGNTLYSFFMDAADQNNYTEPDFSNNALWPIHNSVGAIPSILDASDFGTIEVHGTTQMTYKGWPLYKFQQDEKRGDNYGVGFPEPGFWPIVNQFTEPAM